MTWAWLKVVLTVLVALAPGGFPVLLSVIALRALWRRWHQARVRANGGSVSVREVVSSLDFRDLVREARAAL